MFLFFIRTVAIQGTGTIGSKMVNAVSKSFRRFDLNGVTVFCCPSCLFELLILCTEFGFSLISSSLVRVRLQHAGFCFTCNLISKAHLSYQFWG